MQLRSLHDGGVDEAADSTAKPSGLSTPVGVRLGAEAGRVGRRDALAVSRSMPPAEENDANALIAVLLQEELAEHASDSSTAESGAPEEPASPPAEEAAAADTTAAADKTSKGKKGAKKKKTFSSKRDACSGRC